MSRNKSLTEPLLQGVELSIDGGHPALRGNHPWLGHLMGAQEIDTVGCRRMTGVEACALVLT
jgi:hypothetical protein